MNQTFTWFRLLLLLLFTRGLLKNGRLLLVVSDHRARIFLPRFFFGIGSDMVDGPRRLLSYNRWLLLLRLGLRSWLWALWHRLHNLARGWLGCNRCSHIRLMGSGALQWHSWCPRDRNIGCRMILSGHWAHDVRLGVHCRGGCGVTLTSVKMGNILRNKNDPRLIGQIESARSTNAPKQRQDLSFGDYDKVIKYSDP